MPSDLFGDETSTLVTDEAGVQVAPETYTAPIAPPSITVGGAAVELSDVPQFSFVAADLLTGAIFDQLPLYDVTWQPVLNSSGAWSASIDGYDPRAALVAENRTVIYVCDDTAIRWAGIVLSTDWAGNVLKMAGGDLWSYPEHRRIRTDLTYTGVDEMSIAAALLADMASGPNEDIGLTVRRHPVTAGVTRTIAWQGAQRKTYAEAVLDLSVLQGGIDVSTTAEWVGPGVIGRYVDLWYPNRGQLLPLTWEHGKNCSITSYGRDGVAFANRVDMLGQGSGAGSGLIGTATAAPGVYARWDALDTAKDQATQAVLDSMAAAMLAKQQLPLETIQLQLVAQDQSTVTSKLDTDYRRWQVGDLVRVHAAEGVLRIDGNYRIVDASFKIDVQGQLTADRVTVAKNLPGTPVHRANFFVSQIRLAKKVESVSRIT